MDTEPKPQPRPIDNLLELYIKIGGYVGVGAAIASFAGVCGFSFWMFYVLHLGHFNSLILDALIALGTLVSAALVAVSVFFSASVLWLPMIIGLIICASALQNFLIKFHEWHPKF